jgi:hypothetical protein
MPLVPLPLLPATLQLPVLLPRCPIAITPCNTAILIDRLIIAVVVDRCPIAIAIAIAK